MAEMLGRTKSWLAWVAGAVLALVFGSAGCGKSQPPVVKYGPPPAPPVQPAPKPPDASPAVSLEETEEWRAVMAAFKPMDGGSPGVSNWGAVYAKASESLGKLSSRGLLTPQEAKLLDMAVGERNKEWLIATTCYDMAIVLPQKESLDRLKLRLPLIRELAAAGKIHRLAAYKILRSAEGDLTVLSEEAFLVPLGNRRAEAEKTRDAVKVELEKLRKLLEALPKPAVSLEDSADWKAITVAWDFAMPLALSGRSTTAQRTEADARLQAAREAGERLAAAGLLEAGEADLLAAEGMKIKSDLPPENWSR